MNMEGLREASDRFEYFLKKNKVSPHLMREFDLCLGTYFGQILELENEVKLLRDELANRECGGRRQLFDYSCQLLLPARN